ncbi:spindle and kinetochore-associated protein 3 [Sceloporus undulatus]|uniref:spindle and kinetochore-associated protein 3 n=1 Tax=Sceloporus undulatus TaxID=8520 RepID=UPI001C4D9F3C|nr:spindle and kinetochore-associated protein 3 [Sceloporus undulatus]
MDMTGNFFNKLRTLALTLEKQTKKLKEAFRGNETEFEDDSPMRYLHELCSDVRILKGDVDDTLCKSSSERDRMYDFIKASKVLMKRNATDLEEIRELFQKYGYKPVAKDTAINNEMEISPTSSTFENNESKDPDSSGKSSGPFSPVQMPQLSDFGLSKYALPSTSAVIHSQLQVHVPKAEPRRDNSECISPKTENFHIHGRNLYLNDETISLMEDQTIFLLNNAKNIRQANKLSGSAEISAPNVSLAISKQTTKLCDDDYMASPVAPTFCTPGVKIPHRKTTIVQKSPQSNPLGESNHTSGKPLPDSQSLQTEPNYVCTTTVVLNNDLAKGADVPDLYSDEHLECDEEPCPPAISDYSNLFSTPPPPPEITVIPKQIFQILSKYNPKIAAPRSLETKEEIATQVERSPVFGIENKENWKYTG